MKQFFSYDPNNGFEFHDTAEQAKLAADNAFDWAQEEAGCDGWPENVDDICWGEVKQRVTLTKKIDRPPQSELDAENMDGLGNDWSNSDWTSIEQRELLPKSGE